MVIRGLGRDLLVSLSGIQHSRLTDLVVVHNVPPAHDGDLTSDIFRIAHAPMTLLLITRAVIGFAIVFMTCLAAELLVMRMRARFFRAGRRRRRGQAATNLQLPGAVIEMFTTRRNPFSEAYDSVDGYEAELEQLPIMPRAPKVYSGGGFRSRSRTDTISVWT